VKTVENQPTFRRSVSLPSSGSKNKPRKRPGVWKDGNERRKVEEETNSQCATPALASRKTAGSPQTVE
jgi:hypothetical protein